MLIRDVVLAGTLVVALTACGSAEPDDAGAPASSTTAVATTADPPDSTTTAPTTTVAAPVVAVFPTPTDASVALFEAWMAGDLAAAKAASLGPPDQLELLFDTPVESDVRRRTCSSGEFGMASCFFGNGQGGVNVELDAADGGWKIALIDPFS